MGLILFYYIEDTTGRYSLEELRTMQDGIVKFQLQTVPGGGEGGGSGGGGGRLGETVSRRG